jgi:hypothetical protein
MLVNLTIGTIGISLTVLIHTFGLIAITHIMSWLVLTSECMVAEAASSPLSRLFSDCSPSLTVEIWL